MDTQFVKGESSTSSHFYYHYDVFLSFRGEDTRKNFTSHLYFRLCQVGVNTFIDDEELRKGEVISVKLEKAIEESRVAIVVFSKNYASSSWCLDELVKILDCRERLNQVVLPIFYDVDPSQVRRQTGSFGEALAKHKERLFGAQRVEKWKAALTEAANLSGWNLQNVADGNESKFIESIIKQVSQEVNIQTPLDVAWHPVGVDSRVKAIELLLQSGCEHDIRMVGICGVGGIGKTTLAKAIYNQLIFQHFGGSCFLSDVRSESEAFGLVKLQEKLLRQVLKIKDVQVSSIAEGVNLIKARLGSKKVLIVLDDVGHSSQLESLTRERSWFGSGSVIIITTRDEHLLCGLREDERYEAKLLYPDESLQLLSRCAFNSLSPPQGYVELAQDVIKYSGGLPLALVTLGSHLQGRSVEEWRCEFEKLRAIPHCDIQKILKISFDGLDSDTQSVFLDISCTFHGFSNDEVTKTLYACGFYSESAIATLVKRHLLQRDELCLRMHDLVRDMGREIVRMESRYPGKRSRLFDPQDVRDVLQGNKGSKNVEVLVVERWALKGVNLSTKAFQKMINLRVLIIDGELHISGNFELLSKTCSSEYARDLKKLNLSDCQRLRSTPNFNGSQSFETLWLWNCSSLKEIHPSIGNLDILTDLRIKQLPGSVEMLRDLINLQVGGPNLEAKRRFSQRRVHHVESLPIFISYLSLSYCGFSEADIPRDIGSLSSLRSLDLSGNSFHCLPCDFSKFRFLRELRLNDCENLQTLPSLSNLEYLKILELRNCKKLVKITGLDNLPSIMKMDMINCTSLQNPFNEGFFSAQALSFHTLKKQVLRICVECNEIPDWCSNKVTAPSICFTMPTLLSFGYWFLFCSSNILKYLSIYCCKNCRHESKFIEGIIKQVLQEVNQTPLDVAHYPIGLDSPIKHIEVLLQSGCEHEVRMVGICGVGGIGKTTLAKAIYNRIFQRFDGTCFLSDIRSKTEESGLVKLQEKLLYQILKTKEFEVDSVAEGVNLIKARLGSQKVLIVLDDVDHRSQLESLTRERSWFGSGSVIIITTRDEHLLYGLTTTEIYQAKLLNENEAQQLFYCHAFNSLSPPQEYVKLAQDIIKYSYGLPLALVTLGSHLLGRSVKEWRYEFKKLKAIPHGDIQKILKISFDGLDVNTRSVFLDIACAFHGCYEDEVAKTLNACGFYSESAISTLVQRNLLQREDRPGLVMHDLVQEMGREIVRMESQDPGKRSRLFNPLEAIDVLQGNKGSENVEILVVERQALKGVKVSTKAFQKMKYLRVLKIDDLHISGDFELLSKELRWLSWKGCPLKCIPSNFPSEKLVFLNMKGSNIQEFGLNLQYCRNLKKLDLSDCKSLRKTPNFNGSRSLKTLWLENCSSLKEIHPSIGNLDRLTDLKLNGCKKITDLPSSICQLKSLQYLYINDCLSLQTLPVDIGDMQSLSILNAGETGIKELPGSVEMLGNLIILELGGQYLETKRRFSQRRVRCVEFLPIFITMLSLRYCGFSEADVPRDIGSLSNLHDLDLSGNSFLNLPFDFSKLPRLSSLHLNDCENLQTLPSISNLKYLTTLELRNCQKLVKITGLDNLPSIEKMGMINCTLLQNPFNEGFFSAHALSIPSRKHQRYELSLQINHESNEIPDWCSNKVTATSICLTMPTVHNNKFLGMVLWFVCRLCDVHELIHFAVTVAHIKRSGFSWIWPCDRSDSHEVSYVYYFSYSNDTPFKGLNIKGGEQITVENETGRGTVKKIGIHLLYLDQHGNVTSLPGVVDHSYTPSYPQRLSAGHINSNNDNISNEILQVRSVLVDINEQSSESVFSTMENVFHRNRSWTWIYQMITMPLKCLIGKCFSGE
ncbi:TMV resistance protein N-like [Solanum tuberosum]|uniref:TMV resistance protein N-like n=1 Tax=Solanum tuberosum TaxID=4113 RepID=UPI00073A081A|nr:PREDICTED: TMV resistance protein N-like [Solanum tuberosum]